MATDNTTVYNALGDLPTNYQAFEDDTTSATDADKERADSLKALYENEDAIVNMCSVVGAVIWQSWKKRSSTAKHNNLFNAIAAIIAEDSKKSGISNATTSWEAKLENFFNFSWIDKWFGKNKKEQAEQLSDFQQQALTSLQSIDKVVELLTFAQVKDSNIDLIAIATDSLHAKLSIFIKNTNAANELIIDEIVDWKTKFIEVLSTSTSDNQNNDNVQSNVTNIESINLSNLQKSTQSGFDIVNNHLQQLAKTTDLILEWLLDSESTSTADAQIKEDAVKSQDTSQPIKLSIEGKEAVVSAYDNLLGTLSTLTDKKKASIYRGLAMLDDIVDKLAKVNPKFEKTLNQTADIAISVGTKIKENSNAIEQLNVLIGRLEIFVNTGSKIGGAIVKFGLGMVAFAGSLFLMSKMVTLESLGMFALTALTIYGSMKLFEKVDAAQVLKVSASLLIFSAGLATLALTLSLVPKVLDTNALLNVALVGLTVVGLIYAIRWAKPAEFGKEVLLLSASVATLVLAFALGGEVMRESWQDALMIVSFVVALGVAVGLANRIAGGKTADGKGMALGVMGISASIAILGLAIWGWHQVVPSWEYAIAPVGCMLALAGAMAVVGKTIGSGKDALNIGIGMALMSASVGILALALLPWNLVDTESAVKAGIGVALIATALGVLNALGNKRGGIMQSAIGLAIASASVAVLGASLLIWNNVSTESAVTAGLFLAALTGAVLLLGKDSKASMLGGTALAIAAASTVIFAAGLLMTQNVPLEAYLQFGLFIAAVSGAAIGLGAVASMALLGGAALLVIGGATLVFANAMQKVGDSNIEWKQIGQLATIMGGLALVATGVGNPFTVGFTLAGAAALVVVGTATLQFAKAIKAVSDTNLSPKELQNIGNSLASFIDIVLTAISRNSDKLKDAEKGIEALSDLGTLIYNLSEGLKGMADLVFPKYAVRDGKLVITDIIDMNEAIPKIGANIAVLLKALEEPLIRIGEQGAWYSGGNKVKRGIDALADIGDVFVPLAEGIIKMSQLQFVQYEVKDGKLVPVRVFTEEETKKAIKDIGPNIAMILTALEEPLAKIGESGTWFNKNHTKKGVQALAEIGKVFSPITDLLDAVSKNPKFSNEWIKTEFNPAINGILTTISDIAKRVNDSDEIDIDLLKERIETLDSLVGMYKKIGQQATDNVKFAESFQQVNNSLDKLNLDKLSKFVTQFKTLQSKSIVDSITGLAQSINGPLTAALEKLFAKLEQAINKLNLPVGQSASSNMPALSTNFAQITNSNNSQTQKLPIQSFGSGKEIPEDVDLSDVYMILSELYDTITSVGIRVY